MAEAFKFELVSPERLLVSEEVESVVIPGAEGEMTVMANHAPVMTTVKPGVVTVKTAAGQRGALCGVRRLCRHPAVRLHAARRIGGRGEDIDRADLARRIQDAREDVADATDDATRTKAEELLAQLTTLEAALERAPAGLRTQSRAMPGIFACRVVPMPRDRRGFPRARVLAKIAFADPGQDSRVHAAKSRPFAERQRRNSTCPRRRRAATPGGRLGAAHVRPDGGTPPPPAHRPCA